ncbi:dienelactone hydrolase family protein [Acinetobacter sp. XS-4]|uniref:alpha/beta hydrolase n=1 Tax=Acinetobacter sp. XS-4 TaxID=2923375 RepID=UPI00208DF086|nr:dienelactone hydrolase family protein [Acinetobacter sp. XS-4]USP42248.1 alpha/beta hydrolase [Acinetobacter sp. XS-4]
MKDLFVILLHGVGSNGEDLEAVGEFLKANHSNLNFVTPNAPFSFMNSKEAYQWFNIAGVNEENRFSRIKEARAHFDQKIQEIITQNQLENHLDKVVFLGFSQGAIMALDAVVSGRWPIAGLISIAGRLASPINNEINHNTKILLIHGESDTVIPPSESQSAYQQMHAANLNVELNILPATGHTISHSALQLSLDFLNTI